MDKPVKSFQGKRVGNHPGTTWVFDLDNTLYPASCDLFAKIDVKMGEFISKLLDVDGPEARRVQKDYFVKFGTTLQGLIKIHGVDPNEFLTFVHDIDLTSVEENKQLKARLESLKGKKYVFTNGDIPYAGRVLDRIGVAGQIDGIFDIAEAGFIPKPNPETYDNFVRRFDFDPTRAVMFEDMARNLVPASKMGMTTVWIKTSSQWGMVDYDRQHIHYQTDRLTDWFDEHLEEA